jgi:AcrR family transcriptional regulator
MAAWGNPAKADAPALRRPPAEVEAAMRDRRERAARRRLIITTARKLAKAEGWDAVTTRPLSTEIEYSQPVLYKHFTAMEQIAEAVAIDGFG